MTWHWRIADRETIIVESPAGDEHTLKWDNHKPEESAANGWTWSGEHPEAVYNLVVDEDVQAALKGDIERS